MVEYIQGTTGFRILPLAWQKAGLQCTATGYGDRMPTEYMVKVAEDGGRRWRRVYCACWSNVGTLYVFVQGRKRILDELELETLRDKYYQTHSREEVWGK